MNKLTLSLLTLAMAAPAAWAAPVSRQQAERAATQYLSGLTGRSCSPREVLTTDGAYYVVNMAPQGWVIVAADDHAQPIVGYNPTGSITWHAIPETMRWFLGEARDVIRWQAQRGRADARWANIARLARETHEDGSVDPLIAVTWDQGDPFNQYCPMDGSTRSFVGCVAVAMGQAMSVQQWPTSPRGSMSYSTRTGSQSVNYDAENDYDWELMLKQAKPRSGTAAGKEVARLLYHAGVSVRMNYGASGSGIPSNDAQRISTALVKYFSYPESDIKCTYKIAEFRNDNEGWKQLIYNELDAGRAVVYNAVSMEGGGRDAGHSFNVDGYNGGNGMYHLNWGWGGSSNGYFDLMVLAVSGYKYNKDQVVITGIGGLNHVLRTVALSDNIIDENLPAGTVVGLVSVNGEAPKPEYTITVTGEALKNGGFKKVPFEVKGEYLVTTQPLRAADYAEPVKVKIRVTEPGGDVRNGNFIVNVVKERTIAAATNFKYDRATGRVDIRSKHGVAWELKGQNGAVLHSGSMDPLPYATVETQTLAPGQYTLVMTDSRETKTVKITR